MTPIPEPLDGLPGGGHCPACGGPLALIHRHALDRVVSLFRTVHRYRCTVPGCGWEGVLGRTHGLAPRRGARVHLLVWLVAGATLGVAASEGARWVLRKRAQAAPRPVSTAPLGVARQAQATPPGVDFMGAALPDADPRVRANPSPLRLRHGCAWGVPGSNPYRGTVEQALGAARLPDSVVRQISTMAAKGWVHDTVEITRAGIRSVDGRHEYSPAVQAMAFADTLCFNTRVNFPAGHVEYAAMYQAADTAGRQYTVMIPYVCQNVSVLGEREEIEDIPEVPEPGTLGAALLGLGLLAWSRRRRAGHR